MYSRSVNSKSVASDGFRVPKNYSGNAFSFEVPKYGPPVMRESDIIPRKEEKRDEPSEEVCKDEITEDACNDETTQDICKNEAAEDTAPKVCEKEEKSDGLLAGFSFEDILIVALILILSQNGAQDDILLLLSLILAYRK